jgi:MoxR-like ATPase
MTRPTFKLEGTVDLMKTAEAGERILSEVRKVVIGQDSAQELVLASILADGHVLLEGVPGLAKTLLVRVMAKVLGLDFKRVQFTPDLMPSDVLGTNVFDQRNADFTLKKGPIFTSILLADEINRTPPKTQAALLEAMEERQVTIDGNSMALPYPFLVFATQNPVEFEGTYPLPEAQQDRFLLKVVLGYPQDSEEIQVLQNFHKGFRSQKLELADLQAVSSEAELREIREEVKSVTIEDKMFRYIYDIVAGTRKHPEILVGASPRAGLALVSCSQAIAALRGRNFVIPDDIKDLALPVLRHRILLRPEAEIEGQTVDTVVRGLVETQVVPR